MCHAQRQSCPYSCPCLTDVEGNGYDIQRPKTSFRALHYGEQEWSVLKFEDVSRGKKLTGAKRQKQQIMSLASRKRHSYLFPTSMIDNHSGY